MRNAFLLIALSAFCMAMFIGCMGCYTAKKAEKQILKAAAVHPEVVSGIAARLYPPKDSIIIKDSIRFDTLISDGDVIIDTSYLRDTVVITKTVPKLVTKTVTQTKEVYRTNTAQVEHQARIIDKLTKDAVSSGLEYQKVVDKHNAIKERVRGKILIPWWWIAVAAGLFWGWSKLKLLLKLKL